MIHPIQELSGQTLRQMLKCPNCGSRSFVQSSRTAGDVRFESKSQPTPQASNGPRDHSAQPIGRDEPKGSVFGAIQSTLRKYGTFEGRSSRSEFWYFVLFTTITSVITGMMDSLFGTAIITIVDGDPIVWGGYISYIVSLALLVPSLTVSVRRLHDIGKSGWWMLAAFVPIVGWILLIIWYCIRGDDTPNRFGDKPIYYN